MDLKVDLFDFNNVIIDHAIYRLKEDSIIFSFLSGTVKLNLIIQLSTNISLKVFKVSQGCSSRPVLFLGPIKTSSILCKMKVIPDPLYDPMSISTGIVFIRSYFDYCVRAKGHFFQFSHQPEGFIKTVRMNENILQCCMRTNQLTAIC
ncbi:hypothetical protein MXB_1714 [Myxobolus squamalis]|nr:hypothetical protein MXB_1714 [Myxobolus squamalis]